jgi:metal-dependent amidase/aminoacylase/carboxypeptidase family protein
LSNKASTDLTWQGDAVPVSHACGHDCHTAIVLAAAEALSKSKDSLKGSVMIIFQSCEESSAEARGWGMYVWTDGKKQGFSAAVAWHTLVALYWSGRRDAVIRGHADGIPREAV